MSRMKDTLVVVLICIVITTTSIASEWKENAKAIDISGGEDHTLVLTQNKWPWACGPNNWYQLGIEDSQDQKRFIRVLKGDMNSFSDYLEDINDIDAGWKHSLALESYDPFDPNFMGYVWAWGRNDESELGNQESGNFVKDFA